MVRQVLTFDAETGIRMLKGIQARFRQVDTPYLMRTNSLGFRTREFDPERSEGRRRILFYGDSFTEGIGVSDGRRFTDVLERLVPDAEVLNFGVRATGTDQQFLFFRRRPAGLRCDLVVIGLYVDDIKRNGSRFGVMMSSEGASFEKPYFELIDGQLELRNVPVPSKPTHINEAGADERDAFYYKGLLYRLRMLVRQHAPWAKSALQRLTRYQPAPYLKSADDPSWVLTRAIVDRWAAEAGVPVLVVAIPPYQYVERTASARAYRKRLAELADSSPVTVHDPLDDLVAAGARLGDARRLRIPGDAHFSVEGHEALARSMAPVVTEILGSSRMTDQIGQSRENTS